MPTPRTTLTKSLHTVTAVGNLANHFGYAAMMGGADMDYYTPAHFVRKALEVLGYPSDWPETDETFAKCVRAAGKVRSQGETR